MTPIQAQTPMSAERFGRALTYAQYKQRLAQGDRRWEHLTQSLRRYEKFERENVLDPETVQALRALPRPVKVAVVTDENCRDSMATVPLIVALAESAGTLDVRIFPRDENVDLADAHLYQGRFRSTPAIIFYDEGWTEAGVWIEKPALIREVYARRRTELFRSDPMLGSPETPFDQMPDGVRRRYWLATTHLRDELVPLCNRECQREWRDLLLGQGAQEGRRA